MPFDIGIAMESLPRDMQKRARARLAELRNEQRALGMEPRKDSQLSFAYAKSVDGDEYANDSPHTIACELVCIDAIFKKTDYPLLIEDALRRLASKVRTTYRLDWTTTWQIVKCYGPTLIKLYCARKATVPL